MSRNRTSGTPVLLPDHCPVCDERLILPYGPPASPWVVVSSQPGEWEVRHRRPFVPQAPAGRVLHREMALVGLSTDDFLLLNVWWHLPNDLCLDWHVEQTAKVLTQARAVLFLGHAPVSIYLESSVKQIGGVVLRRAALKKHPALAHTELVVCGPNPADAYHEGVGELQLALRRFSVALKILKGEKSCR